MKNNFEKTIRFLPLLLISVFILSSCSAPLSDIISKKSVSLDNQEAVNAVSLSASLSAESAEIIPTSLLDVLCQPNGITVENENSFLVTDLYNRVIWRVENGKTELYSGFSATGDLYGQPVGGYNDSTLEKSAFKEPWAIAPFLDGFAVSDSENGVLRLVRENGVETINARTETGADATTLNHPTGLATDDEGNLYVAETFSDRIRMISPDGVITTAISGVSEPTGLYMKDGALYIAESGANRISVFKDGKLSTVAGSGESGFTDGSADKAEFSSPQGITVSEDGTIYVSDTANSAVRVIREGQVSTLISRDLTDINEFFPIEPTGLLIADNLLYVCDPYARKLLAVYI